MHEPISESNRATLREPARTVTRENDKLFCEPEDEFTRDRYTIFEQASRIQRIYFNVDYPFGDSFLVFSRSTRVVAPEGWYCNTSGLTMGVQIVAYRCDENGVVSNWEHRFEVEAACYDLALSKLRYLIANDLIYTENREDIEEC